MTTFGDQLYQYGGTPVTGGLPFTTGKVYFVDSVTGSDGNSGKKPNEAKATIAGAITVATASAGDIIAVVPWHVETITAATATWSKAGVQIIGLGSGTNRPTITFTTAATATITVTAAKMAIQNMRFIANFANVAAAITTTAAAGLTVDSCYFADTSAILNFLVSVKTSTVDNAADSLTMTNNVRIGAGLTAATSFVNIGAALDQLTLANNNIKLLFAGNSALIYQPTTTKVLTNVVAKNNVVNVVGADAATGVLMITTATTHTGIIEENYVFGARAVATAVLVTASSGFKFVENYYQTAADKSGILLPANA
jgi:hypothetical protein